jgi:hypothetical protein
MASGAASNYGVYGSISQSGVGIYAENSATALGIQYGMRAKKTGSNADGYGVGIQADASGSAQENYGAFFTGAGGGRNYGMKSIASGAGTFNYGGMFTADGATNNYAVYATTIAANGIGIYGENKSTDIGNPIGVYGNKTGSTGLSAGNGVKGNAAGSSLVKHGGYFTSADAQTNYGLRSFATGTATTNIGGSFYASGATNNYAAIFEAGNVGIGVNAPISALQVKGNLKIFNNATNTHTGLFYNGTADVNGFELYAAANDAYLGLQRNGQYASLNLSKKTGTGDFQAFFINGALVGTISTNGATTSYNTTSDYRLKENIQPTQTGLQDIMNIQVEDYTYKTDPDKSLQTGFLAQDLYKIFPQAVHAGGDDPATDPWTIDYSKLTPMLVKAVQEEQLQLKDLKSEIAGLKNALILANAANEKLTALTERLNKLEKVASQK